MRELRLTASRGYLRRPLRGALAAGLAALSLLAWLGSNEARADVVCPNPIPVVNENQCKTGTSSWRVGDNSPSLGGFTTRPSVDRGENVVLKIGRNGPVSPTRTVDVAVYRMGYYQDLGGRLVTSASNVPINNDFSCEAMDQTTGLVDCGNWSPTYTIPGSALPASGVYLAKLTASTGEESQVVFTVRDDERQPQSEILYVLPIASYQAYNLFGGKSLYFGYEGESTVSGTSRAVKVSFNRPFAQAGAAQNWLFGPDLDLLSWMEKQGYDVSYSDDVQVHGHPSDLLDHNTAVISGHSEYWSLQEFDGFLAAREAGVNIASFSANTAYWKVRYEDGERTLVCYKTVEGGGTSGSGAISQNDWGPDGVKDTADDALGLDGKAGTADDNPQNSTTTFRDNGAPPGDPSAPPGGRVGPDMPENQLFGVMYVGDNDAAGFPVTVPPGNGNEELASNRLWRNTGIPENSTTNIGTFLVNWEWDAIPTQAQYLAHQPSGVKRVFVTNVQTADDNSWLQDEGRLRSTSPPPGQPGTVGAAEYTAASGAMVFASGTMEWARGLSSERDERIEQVTYNVLSDMGAQPNTPAGVTLDPTGSNRAPNAGFTLSQNPAKSSTPISFDASPSNDPDGQIVKYEWDLDGDGTYETGSGTNPAVTGSFPAEGEYQVRLRVTDDGGATDLAVRTVTIIDNQPPTAAFTATPDTIVKGESIAFNGAGSSDTDGTIAGYEWDLDGNGTYETSSGSNPEVGQVYATPGSYTVGLRVTDDGGKTATTTRPISVGTGEVSHYSESVLATPGLVHYWRMGEQSGTTFADSVGSSTATASGATTFGAPGGVANDPDKAASFDGATGSASAPVNLSGTHAVTVEFWLRWNSWENNDDLAMELTNNFNEVAGGFLIDPSAPQLGGTFGIGIGTGTARNNVFFSRPTAGQWHHYAFVLNSSAPAAEQIVPYVDGHPVAYTKVDSGTGAGNFANSTLFMMSRAGASLFGPGSLDEVAIYRRALSATTISNHHQGIVVEEEVEEEPEEGSGGGEEEEETPPGGTGPSYTETVRATPGLLDYWRMDEPSGPILADSVGPSPATASGEPTFAAPGGVPGDSDKATAFDGANDAAGAAVDLSGKTALTVEFWMKWNGWGNDDRLALEFTPNFNDVAGGFLVDPNSSYGSFGVALGIGSSRNVALFARPSAGAWHHYAFALDTTAAAAEQIVPYVDGKPVTYTKAQNGSGAGAFAGSTLYLMSRAGSALFGAGTLDDLALYDHALSAATVAEHFHANGANTRPVAAFQAPATAKVGDEVTFNASGSSDPNGTIAKYEWDLDGDGSYETDSGTSATVSHAYAGAGSVNVGLRITDDEAKTAATVRTVLIEAVEEGGSEEGGGTQTDYPTAVLGTPGLLDYWRLGETSGSTLADSAGASPATTVGEPALDTAGALPEDTATAFDGVNDAAGAAVDLSGKTALTVEFWMKWNGWGNDDRLALEFTPNFNDVAGGFLVDPNSSYGSFGVALGIGSSRNVTLFSRPSAGAWHHYAFVLDTTAAAAEQVVPYVDGKPVTYTKAQNGSGAGAFAGSTLYFMSRAGSALFGAGTLDEVAIYGRALGAAEVAQHYAAN